MLLQALVPAQEATSLPAADTIPGRSPLVMMGLAWVAIASVVSYREVQGDRPVDERASAETK